MSKNERAMYAEKVWEGELATAERRRIPRNQALNINQMKEAIVILYEQANLKNLDIFGWLFSADFINYGGAGFTDLHGADKFRDLYAQYLVSFPDLIFHLEDVIAEGDLVGLRATITGTHEGNFMGMVPATGKYVSWTGTSISRFNDHGQMNARWQEIDAMSLMQQLGVIPTPPGMDLSLPAPMPPYIPNARYTSPAQNRTLALHMLDEVWNKGNLDVADKVFHPLATCPSAPQLPTGGQGVKILVNMFRSAMPDFHITILDTIADSDRVMVRYSQSGTHRGDLMGIPATGKHADWTGIGELRFMDGEIVESWYNVDMMGLMQQLGLGGASAGA